MRTTSQKARAQKRPYTNRRAPAKKGCMPRMTREEASILSNNLKILGLYEKLQKRYGINAALLPKLHSLAEGTPNEDIAIRGDIDIRRKALFGLLYERINWNVQKFMRDEQVEKLRKEGNFGGTNILWKNKLGEIEQEMNAVIAACGKGWLSPGTINTTLQQYSIKSACPMMIEDIMDAMKKGIIKDAADRNEAEALYYSFIVSVWRFMNDITVQRTDTRDQTYSVMNEWMRYVPGSLREQIRTMHERYGLRIKRAGEVKT